MLIGGEHSPTSFIINELVFNSSAVTHQLSVVQVEIFQRTKKKVSAFNNCAKQKLVFKFALLKKSRVKLQCSTEKRETTWDVR